LKTITINPTSKAVLQTYNLTPGYTTGGVRNTLFEKLNVSLQPGQLVCLMGPNGAGKSTLIRTLARLQKPLAGTLSETTEKSIALVLTDPITSISMSVYELITFGRYPYLGWNIALTPEDKQIVGEAIRDVRIQHLVDKKINELSDGQLQMAMIARALAQRTPILLLDEPTAHLDLNNRLEIMNLLRTLARTQHKAILVATHELDLALQTADLIWLATQDKKIKVGIPEDLVLDGSLDEVFQFKGFDLKTGKINHEPHLGIAITLVGSGHELLWTKNALERNGFEISDNGKIEVVIENDKTLVWKIANNRFDSLQGMLEALKNG
jgi:iron complex transport system ATP-binding protein